MAKKNHSIWYGVALVTIAGAYVSSCAAPGSSKPIKSEDPKISIKEDTQRDPNLVNPGIDSNKDSTEITKPSDFPVPVFSNVVDSNSPKPKSKHFISADEKIKYLAFGDSITAGFDGTLPKDYPGELKNGKIEGVSYPAFLANLLNVDNRVQEFKNFAISGSTILDWLNLLEVDYPTTENNSNSIEVKHGAEYAQVAQDFKNRLSSANLITFTLGSNDFFRLVIDKLTHYDFSKVLKQLQNPQPAYGELVTFVNDVIGSSLKEVNKRLITLVSKIKTLAPNANINMVSYGPPLLGLKKAIDNWAKELLGGFGIEIKPLNYLVEILDAGFKSVASLTGIDYFLAYNDVYWDELDDKFWSVFLDIHPNTLGYKKMAMDLYLKMTTPTFGLSSYQAYDFNEKYLLDDASTINYEIEVTQTPEQVLGTNTLAYIDKATDFEKSLIPLRDPINFGKRLLIIANWLKDGVHKGINWLLSQPFFHKLDPQEKLAKLINQTDAKDLIDDLADKLIESGIFTNSALNIQNKLAALKKQGEIQIKELPQILLGAVVNENNIVGLIAAFAKSRLVNDFKEPLKDALNDIVANAIDIYGDQLVDFVIKAINEVTKNKLSDDKLRMILSKVVHDQYFKNIAQTLAGNFVDNSESFAQAKTYTDMVLALLKNQDKTNELAHSLSEVAQYFLNDEEIQNLLGDLLYQFLNDNDLATEISQEQTTTFTKDLLKVLKDQQIEQVLLSDFLNELLKIISDQKNYFDLQSALNQALSNTIAQFFKFEQNDKLANLLRSVFNSGLLLNNKDFLKQLIHNILYSNKISLQSIIQSVLPEQIKSQIDHLIGDKNFQDLLMFVLNQPQLKDLVEKIIANVIEHSDKLKEFDSITELVGKSLTLFDLDQVKSDLNDLINTILGSEEIKPILKSTLSKLFNQIGVDSNQAGLEQLINGLSNNFKQLIDYFNLQEPLLNALFEKLKEAQQSADPLSLIKSIPNVLAQIVQDSLTKDLFKFTKGLINLDLFANFDVKSAFAKVVVALVKYLNEQHTFDDLVAQLIDKNAQAEIFSKYLDLDEIKNLATQLLHNDQTIEILDIVATRAITSELWQDDQVTNFQDFIFKFLQNVNLQNELKPELTKVLVPLLQQSKLAKTFAKTINVLIEPYGLSASLDQLEKLGDSINEILANIFKNQDFTNNLFTKLFEAINQATSIEDIIPQISSTLPSLIDQDTIFAFVKAILNSSLVSEHAQDFKNTLNSLLDQLKTTANRDKIIEDTKLSLIFENLGLSNQESKIFINDFLTNDKLIEFIKKVLKHFVDQHQLLAQATSFNHLIDLATRNNDFIKTLNEDIKAIVKSILNNDQLKKILAQTLHKLLVQYHLDTNLTQEQTDQAVSDLITFVKENQLVNDFIGTFVDRFIDNLYLYGASSITKVINESLSTAANHIFNQESDENYSKIVQLINEITSSEFINQNKDYLKQLLGNIIAKLPELSIGNLIYQQLPDNVATFIANAIGTEKFNEMVNLFFSLDDTQNILVTIKDRLLDNIASIQNAKNLGDLVKKVIRAVDFDSIKEPTQQLFKELISNAQFAPLFESIFKELYKFVHLDPETEYNARFIKELSTSLKEILDQFGLENQLIETLFNNLTEAAKADKPQEVLAELPKRLGNVVSDIVFKNPKDFIRKVIKLNIFQNNKEALVDLIKAIYNVLSENGTIKKLIESQVIPQLTKAPVANYVDAEEIGDLLIKTIENPNFKNFIFGLIDGLIHNTAWLDHLDSAKDFANAIISMPNVLDQVESLVKPLLKYLLTQNKLQKTLGKVAYQFATDNGYTFNQNQLTTVAKNLLSSVIPYLENTGLLDQLINTVFSVAKQEKDIDSIVEKLPKELLKLINLQDFKIVKYLLSSNLFTKNTATLKSVLQSFIDQFTSKETFNQLVDQFDIAKLVPDFSFTAEQTQAINNFIKAKLRSEEIKDVLKKGINFIIDNASELALSNNYQELAFKVLRNQAFISSIEETIKKWLKEVLTNEEIQELLAQLLSQQISKTQFSWIFNKVQQPHKIFVDALKLINILDQEFEVINKLFNALKEFSESNASSLEELSQNILGQFSELFSPENQEKTIIKLIHLFNDSVLAKHKEEFGQIFENIYDKFIENTDLFNTIYNYLPDNLKQELNKYLNVEDQKYVLKFILETPEVKALVLSAIKATLSDSQGINQANSYNELIQLIFSKIDFASQGKTLLDTLINKINADDHFKAILKQIANNVIEHNFPELHDQNQNQFISDVVENIVALLKELNIYQPALDVTFEELAKLKNNPNYQEVLRQLPAALIEVIQREFNKNPKEFITKILNNAIIRNNNDYVVKLGQFIIGKLIDNQVLTNLVKGLVDNLSADILAYVDKDSLKELVDVILTKDNVLPITQTLLDYAIKNQDWVQNWGNVGQLIFDLLKNSNLLTLDKNHLNLILSRVLTFEKLDLTIQKALSKLLADQGYEHGISKELANGIQGLLIQLNNSTLDGSLISLFIDLVADKIANANDFQDLISQIQPQLVQRLRLNQYSTVKTILQADIWTDNNKAELKKIAHFFFDKYYNDQNIQKIIDLTPKDKISQVVGLTEEEISSTLREILQSEQIKSLANKVIDYAIEHAPEYGAADSFDELVKQVASNQDFVALIKPDFKALLNIILNKESTKDVLAKVITNFLDNENINKFLVGITNKQELVKNLIGVYDIFDAQLGISDIIFNGFIDYVKVNGTNFSNVSSIASNLFNGIRDSLAENTESKVVAIVRGLATSNLFTQSKQDIITIIDNILTNIPDEQFNNTVVSLITKGNDEVITKYLPIDDFKKLLSFVRNNQNFRSLFNGSITQLINNISEYSSVNSYQDIVAKTLQIINLDQLESSLKGLINDLLTTEQVHNILYNFLKTTLKNFNVNVEDAEVDALLRAISSNIKQLADQVDLFEPIINEVFKILKSDQFKANPAEEINTFSTRIKEIFTAKVTSDIKGFADKILDIDFIRNNWNGVIKVVTQALQGFNQEGKIAEFINKQLEGVNLETGLLQYLSVDDFKELITNVLKYPQVNDLIAGLVPNLLNNREWLAHFNEPKTLVWTLLKTSNNIDIIKEQASKFVEQLLKEEPLKRGVTAIFNGLLNKNNLAIDNLNKLEFIGQTLDNIVPILKQAQVYDLVFEKIFDLLKSSDSLDNFIEQLPTKMLELLQEHQFNLVKAILQSDYLTNQKQAFKEIIQSLIYTLTKKPTQVEALLAKAGLDQKLGAFGTNAHDLSLALQELFKSEDVQNVLNDFIGYVLDHAKEIANGDSYNDFVKNIFKDSEHNEQLSNQIKGVVKQVLQNNTIKDFVSSIIVNLLNQKAPWILQNVNEPQQVIKSLLASIDLIEQKYGFINLGVNATFEFLQEHGYQGDPSLIFSKFTQRLQSLFEPEHLQENILKLLQTLVQTPAFSEHPEDVKTILNNVINYFAEQTNFGDLIWNQLSATTQSWIENNLFSKDVLEKFANKGAKSIHLRNIILNFINYLIDNKEVIVNAATILDLPKNYLRNENNRNYFKSEFKQLLNEVLGSSESATAIKNILTNIFAFLEVNIDDKIQRFIDLVANQIVPFTDRLGLLDNVIDAIVELFLDNKVQTDTLITDLKEKMLSKIQPTSYNFFKKFIGDQLITQNKEIVYNALNSIVYGITHRDGRLQNWLEGLNVGGTLVPYDAATVNNMLVRAIKDEQFFTLVNKLLNSVVFRAEEYANLNSWGELLNHYLKMVDQNEVKTILINWFKGLTSQANSAFNKGIGSLLHKMLKDKGFAFNNDSDLQLMYKVANAVLQSFGESDLLDGIFNKMITLIKSIDFTRVNHPEAALTKAVTMAVLSPLLSDDYSQILSGKVFDFGTFISAVTAKMQPKDFSDFVNRLFETSSLENVTGIYQFINNQLSLGLTPENTGETDSSSNQSGSNDQNNQNEPNKDYEWNKPFAPTFKLEIVDVFRIEPQVKKLLGGIYGSLQKYLFEQATSGSFDFTHYKKNSSYKALYRVNTLVHLMLKSLSNTGDFAYWNFVGPFINRVYESSWYEAYNIYKSRLTKQQILKLGGYESGWFSKTIKPNYEYITGNQGNGTYDTNYWEDQIRAYIEYGPKKPPVRDRFNKSKTMLKVLLESFENGYLAFTDHYRTR
ncbi:SGNH/GDSL hydrolase family protein [Mycoplasmopsis sturni]|uniref:SGNH/GDSL hydrolase family protein n=1 Tax=Mycoplasmopsis sturni TaxID=39047 RepID=UPI0005679123|nr:SGNH/GDSL hydrolase family protein [Mycoplasmopsis sturni]